MKHTPASETVVQPAVQPARLRRLFPVDKVFWNWQQNPTQKLPSKLLQIVLFNEVSALKFAHLGKITNFLLLLNGKIHQFPCIGLSICSDSKASFTQHISVQHREILTWVDVRNKFEKFMKFFSSTRPKIPLSEILAGSYNTHIMCILSSQSSFLSKAASGARNSPALIRYNSRY